MQGIEDLNQYTVFNSVSVFAGAVFCELCVKSMIVFDFANVTTFLYQSVVLLHYYLLFTSQKSGNTVIKVKPVVQADVKRLYYKRQFAIGFIAS